MCWARSLAITVLTEHMFSIYIYGGTLIVAQALYDV